MFDHSEACRYRRQSSYIENTHHISGIHYLAYRGGTEIIGEAGRREEKILGEMRRRAVSVIMREVMI